MTGALNVPGNLSARPGRIAIAPSWLFAHFPYGDFFSNLQKCTARGWAWGRATEVDAPTNWHAPTSAV